MRHRTRGRKLNRTSAHRRAMLKNLVSSLFVAKPDEENGTFERIITTREKAKEARRLAEKIISLGKRGTLAARRRAIQLLDNKAAVRKVFEEVAPRYANRPGGYTRIIGFPANRLGDNARRVIFELVGPFTAKEARPARPQVAEDVTPPGPAETTAADDAEHESPPAEIEDGETGEQAQDEQTEEEPEE